VAAYVSEFKFQSETFFGTNRWLQYHQSVAQRCLVTCYICFLAHGG
jgi:hypothetical protein